MSDLPHDPPDPLPIEPVAGPVDAVVRLPGSKSITNRALVCAALADGTSSLPHALVADDTEAMAASLSTVGIEVTLSADEATVHGSGGQLAPGPVTLDARASGTTARFLGPVLSLAPGPYRLDGAPSLRARPMAAMVDALRALGATVEELGAAGHLPLVIGGPVAGDGTVEVPGDVSSQFLSGLLLAAPAFPKGLRVTPTGALISRPYVDMTVDVMRAFGVDVERAGATFVVPPAGYVPRRYVGEPDASSASYVFAAAAICGGRVRVRDLGTGSRQGDLAFVDVLERMGAAVTRSADNTEVAGTGPLHGGEFDLRDLSDTAPTLAAVAAFADTPTRVSGIGFIRRKETDRIAAVVAELRRCGVDAEEEPDGFVVRPGTVRPARIETYDDHRIAMSFALIGLRVPGVEIANPRCVDKTFPGYWDLLAELRASSARPGRVRSP